MRITSRLVGGLAVVLFLTVTASAELYVVPSDFEMAAAADAIAVVHVKEIHGAFTGETSIVTHIDVEPELVLKGSIDVGTPLRIVEAGGEVGSQIMLVSAAPRYWPGNRALVFLTREEGQWRTWGAALGKFDFVNDSAGRELAVRWATPGHIASLWSPDGQPHEEKLRDARLFVQWLRDVLILGGQPKTPSRPAVRSDVETAPTDYFVVAPAQPLTEPAGYDTVVDGSAYPPSAYTQGRFRWRVFDDGGSVTFRVSGSQPGYDSVGAAQRGLAAWTNDPGSNVSYVYGGTSSAGFTGDGQNTIVYNQSSGVPAGAIAYAQWFGGKEHVYKNETFYSITEGDVIVKSNLSVSAKVFDEAITHELGHTLGFRHSDQGTPSSTQAVMKSVLSGAYGANLGPWDVDAVRTVYEALSTAPLGVPANLVATATSTSTIVISWTAAPNAAGYQLERSLNNGAFTQIATPSGTSFTDTGRTPGTTYVYRVRAVGTGGTTSTYSNRDHATTIMFTDDPLAPGVTPIKAVHLTELRTAVNAVRAAAGLAPASWTDPSPAGERVKAVHITELRNALTPALAALGKTAAYTDSILSPGDPIKAVHFQELRNLVK